MLAASGEAFNILHTWLKQVCVHFKSGGATTHTATLAEPCYTDLHG